MKKFLYSCAALLFSTPLLALDTGWLELEEGHIDNQSGSSVRSVTQQDDKQIITVAIPKSQLKRDNKGVEEIVIIGRRQKDAKEEPLLDVSYEWANDIEGDNYGLIIKLKHNSKMPIRLHFARDEGSQNP